VSRRCAIWARHHSANRSGCPRVIQSLKTGGAAYAATEAHSAATLWQLPLPTWLKNDLSTAGLYISGFLGQRPRGADVSPGKRPRPEEIAAVGVGVLGSGRQMRHACRIWLRPRCALALGMGQTADGCRAEATKRHGCDRSCGYSWWIGMVLFAAGDSAAVPSGC
jgi:hypothetical protein